MADTEILEGGGGKMTDEEVQALTSEQLIEMVANNDNIPYEQMTDEQLDLMEGGAKQQNGNHNVEDAVDSAVAVMTNGDHPKSAAQKVAAQSLDVDKSQLCKVCGKKVYETEKISVNNSVYHKSCFRCKQCNRVLTMSTYCLSVNGELYCKPHFQQLFKVKGSYNIESNSGALKNFHQTSNMETEAAIQLKTENVNEEDDVSLPDLKSLKSRFESVASGENQETLVIDRESSQSSQASPGVSANVSSLKSQWANMANSSGTVSHTASVTRAESQKINSDEILLCRSASQLRAQFDKNQNNVVVNSNSVSMDSEVAKEDLGQKEKPETISGGLASVKSMFEGGGVKSSPDKEQESSRSQFSVDESLQAAMARGSISSKTLFAGGSGNTTRDNDDDESKSSNQSYVDESLLAARQGRGAAAKSLFESNQRSESPSQSRNGYNQQDELAAIRASRGTNMKALFEGGASSGGDGGAQIVQSGYEDESLAAARASRGVSNKAMFDGSVQSESSTVIRSETTSDVQAGKAKDLLSRFESGQVSDESGKVTTNGRESAEDLVNSGAAKNAKAMFEGGSGASSEGTPVSPVSAREPSEEVEPTTDG